MHHEDVVGVPMGLEPLGLWGREIDVGLDAGTEALPQRDAKRRELREATMEPTKDDGRAFVEEPLHFQRFGHPGWEATER